MKRWIILLLLAMAAIGLLLAAGCSDDDDDELLAGDPNDPNFEGIVDIADGAAEMQVDAVMVNFALMFELEDNKQSQSEHYAEIIDQNHDYNAASGWHVFEFLARVVDCEDEFYCDTTLFLGLDSLRLVDTAGAYMGYTPDPNEVAEMQMRGIFDVTESDGPVVRDTIAFVLTGDFYGPLVLNGTAHGAFEDQEADTSGCAMNGTFAQTFNNLAVDIDLFFGEMDSECPSAGSIALSMSFGATCEEGGVVPEYFMTGNWTVNYSFGGGQVTLTASDGTSSWSFTDWCGPDPTDLSVSDQEFVGDAMGDMLGSFMYELPISFALLTELFTPPKTSWGGQSLQGPDIVVNNWSHSYQNGWHIFSAELTITEWSETMTLAGVDSVRLYEDGVVMEETTQFDRVDTRSHFFWTSGDGSRNGMIHHRFEFREHIIGESFYARLNGTAFDSVETEWETFEGGCQLRLAVDEMVTDLVFDPETDQCPISGRIDVDGMIDIDCYGPGDDFYNTNGSWTVTAVANGDGTVTITFDNGYVNWSVTDTCGEE